MGSGERKQRLAVLCPGCGRVLTAERIDLASVHTLGCVEASARQGRPPRLVEQNRHEIG